MTHLRFAFSTDGGTGDVPRHRWMRGSKLLAAPCLTYNLGMAQSPAPETRDLTAAVQDYAKAIYTLESRDGAASTTELATLLEVRPASVSGMLRKLSELGLVEHERYRGVRLTRRGR